MAMLPKWLNVCAAIVVSIGLGTVLGKIIWLGLTHIPHQP